MTDVPEIKIERQAGGWVWIAIVTNPDDGSSHVLDQSQEAFQNKVTALCDAVKAMKKLGRQAAKE